MSGIKKGVSALTPILILESNGSTINVGVMEVTPTFFNYGKKEKYSDGEGYII